MAIARVTTWSSGQILTASALNGEFDNIINNALALISPLTSNLNVNGNTLQNISAGTVGSPGWYFNNDSNTGMYSTAADTVDISAGGVRSASFATATTGVNYVNHIPAAAASGPFVTAAGSDTNITLNLGGKGTGGVAFNTNSGTPDANNSYSASIIKGWIQYDQTGTLTINASYNVTSVTDTNTGDCTITWDRDFSGNYVITGTSKALAGPSIGIVGVAAFTTGTTEIYTVDSANNLRDEDVVCIIAIGAQ